GPRPRRAAALEHSRSGRHRAEPARTPTRRSSAWPPNWKRGSGSCSPRSARRPRKNRPGGVMNSPEQIVNVRYMVDDVQAAIDFYTSHLGFTLRSSAAPAFADVTRGNLRLLLAGPASSAGRPMPDGAKPGPGGWNRIHFIVPDIGSEVARLRAEGVSFRNEIVTGPGGKQILVADPAGNGVEVFEPASRSPARP